MFVASPDAAFRLGQETLHSPLEFIGKLVEHHAQSPVRKFKMLAEESLGRDETPRQTSHEQFTSF